MFDLITGKVQHAPKHQAAFVLVSTAAQVAIVTAIVLATLIVVESPLPRTAMMTIAATEISATRIAYSTIVAPDSSLRNFWISCFMVVLLGHLGEESLICRARCPERLDTAKRSV